MKAARLIQYNEIAVNNTVPKPAPAGGEVLVQVHAASLNPFDVKLASGLYENIKLKLPATLGGDLAGTVAALGEGVAGFEIGQAVYGMANAAGGRGSFAEFAPVSAKQLAAKPKSLDDATAAALPLTASAAYQAIVENMDLQAGQKILIHGAAGGIGSLAVQIAKQRGAYVATTAAAGDTGFMKGLGADEVIDYRTQDFSEVIKDYDAVFDTVGGETNKKSYQVLGIGGTLVSMLEQPNEARVRERRLTYVQQNTRATTERLKAIAELVDAGQLKAIIDKVFPLDQTADAFEYMRTNHSRGKVVIQIK